MPSGLTYPIYDGSDLSLASYAWRCAGQLFHHGDIPSADEDEELLRIRREFLDESTKELSWWKAATAAEILEKQLMLNEGAKRQLKQDVTEQRVVRERYMTFRAQVESWEPPTKDHEEFKGLMLRTLDDSIEHDCHEPQAWGLRELGRTRDEQLAAAERIREEVLPRAEKWVERERESLREAQENVAKRRLFLRELERVLPKPTERYEKDSV